MDDIDDKNVNHYVEPLISRDEVAFLQYTSGSTSDPERVMIT
jgi:acyl-CoA synthetase (AMP-forming)/AMP-acid ligase II